RTGPCGDWPGSAWRYTTRGCARLLFRPHRREQDHVTDRGLIREQHRQPIDADADTTGRRHAVLECAQVVLVELLRFLVAALTQRDLRLEALALVERVVQFTERVRDLATRDHQLEAFDQLR